jgi:hypothetical protein
MKRFYEKNASELTRQEPKRWTRDRRNGERKNVGDGRSVGQDMMDRRKERLRYLPNHVYLSRCLAIIPTNLTFPLPTYTLLTQTCVTQLTLRNLSI